MCEGGTNNAAPTFRIRYAISEISVLAEVQVQEWWQELEARWPAPVAASVSDDATLQA